MFNHALIHLTSNVVCKYLVTLPVWCYCFILIMMFFFFFNQGDVALSTVSKHSYSGIQFARAQWRSPVKKQSLKQGLPLYRYLSQFYQRNLTTFQGNNNIGWITSQFLVTHITDGPASAASAGDRCGFGLCHLFSLSSLSLLVCYCRALRSNCCGSIRSHLHLHLSGGADK